MSGLVTVTCVVMMHYFCIITPSPFEENPVRKHKACRIRSYDTYNDPKLIYTLLHTQDRQGARKTSSAPYIGNAYICG